MNRNGYIPSIVTAYFRAVDISEPVFEHRFHLGRKWRFDIAWPDRFLAIEVQGGIWTRGRHTRGAAMLKEWEKLNTAASLGWRILYVQPTDLFKLETLSTIKLALAWRST